MATSAVAERISPSAKPCTWPPVTRLPQTEKLPHRPPMAQRLRPRKEAHNERHHPKTHPSKNRSPRISESRRCYRGRPNAGILSAGIEQAQSPERRGRRQIERLRACCPRRYGHSVSSQVGNGPGRGDVAVATAGRG